MTDGLPDTKTAETASEREFDYDRTVALSDGVFAIALTLLVLTISFPELQGVARARLGSELQNRLPQLLSYAVSFAVLAILWLRHHSFCRGLARIDTRLSVLNLAYLAVVAFLPYPTRILGEYGNQTLSVVFYSVTILLIMSGAGLMRLHAQRAALMTPDASLDPWARFWVTPAVFLLSIPIAFASPDAAKYAWLLLLFQGPAARWGRRHQAAGTPGSPRQNR